MKVNYYYDEVGTICDRCGHDIKHVFMIESNGIKYKIGSDCIYKVAKISDYGLKQLKKDIKSLELTKACFEKFSRPINELLEENKDNYGMIEMSNAEQKACDYTASWRQRTAEEYIKHIEEAKDFYFARIQIETEEISKKYAKIELR